MLGGGGRFILFVVLMATISPFTVSYANAVTPTVSERLTVVEENLTALEDKISQRKTLLNVAAVVGVLGFLLSLANLHFNRKDRKADKKADKAVKAFETHYEAPVQSALERLEMNALDLLTASEHAASINRAQEVKEIWTKHVTPAIAGLTEQLLKLDESNNIDGSEWSATIDEQLDQVGIATNTLLDKTKGPKALADAADDFSSAIRKLAESIRSKLIDHKNKLS